MGPGTRDPVLVVQIAKTKIRFELSGGTIKTRVCTVTKKFVDVITTTKGG